MTTPAATPVKAVHTWSLFRTLGRPVAPGSMPTGGMAEHHPDAGLDLLDLPAELGRRGYTSAQLCHFYLRDRSEAHLGEVRSAFAEAGVELECLLIDDGDLTDPDRGDEQQRWVSGWLEAAETLGAPRARVVAGQRPPTPAALDESARRLTALADDHPDLRLVTENWHALLPDAASVTTLLDATDGRIGFLVDLGNWKGPGKYAELAAVAPRAETCQAKVTTDDRGEIDADDYRRCLSILRDAGYTGPLAMVYDGPDDDEWGHLEQAYEIIASAYAR